MQTAIEVGVLPIYSHSKKKDFRRSLKNCLAKDIRIVDSIRKNNT
jgi:hypothetical protein